MQDYGGPVGFRIVLAHPERVEALIVQDAVAHNEGLGVNWTTRRAFWADRSAHEEALRTNLLSLAATKTRHIGDDPNVELYDPDLWTDEYKFLNSPGQAQIQSDLFYDYRTNVGAYPKWQAWMRKTQPKLLVLWESTISHLIPANLTATEQMYRMRKCMCWTPVTSLSIRRQTKSQQSFVRLFRRMSRKYKSQSLADRGVYGQNSKLLSPPAIRGFLRRRSESTSWKEETRNTRSQLGGLGVS